MSAGVKLHIPRLGDKLVLVAPWRFRLFNEHRNETLIAALGYPNGGDARRQYIDEDSSAGIWSIWNRPFKEPVTLPAGTELTVRRIFIRQGARDFDSMTFTATIPPLKPAPRGKVAKPKSVRFWAKLDDCNTMEVVHAGGVVS